MIGPGNASFCINVIRNNAPIIPKIDPDAPTVMTFELPKYTTASDAVIPAITYKAIYLNDPIKRSINPPM